MKLTIVRGPATGKVFQIEEGSNLIGRWDPESGSFPEIDLEAEDQESKISRKHAVIARAGAVASVEDVGSLNGTFINRVTRLEPGQRHTLVAGDEIVVGKTFLKFEP
jgi:pSer/pThr/pTyr-binding forkhead associated (FHA) protein